MPNYPAAQFVALVSGQVVILLEDEAGHQSLSVQPASRLETSRPLHDNWLAYELGRGNLIFQCVKDGCDDRPFSITPGQLEDAEGEIWCDVCESVCIEL